MLGDPAPAGWDEPAGQALFEMANLRPQRTNLPFVVFISQRGGAQHDVRVKVAPGPKVAPSQMGTYSLRPFGHRGGYRLSSRDEIALEQWLALNHRVLVEYWDGTILYTEDALDRIVPVGGSGCDE